MHGSSPLLCGLDFCRRGSPTVREEGVWIEAEEQRGGLQQATILDQDERKSLGAVKGGGAPPSEGFLVGRQVLLCSLVSFQGFYSIDVLRQL